MSFCTATKGAKPRMSFGSCTFTKILDHPLCRPPIMGGPNGLGHTPFALERGQAVIGSEVGCLLVPKPPGQTALTQQSSRKPPTWL